MVVRCPNLTRTVHGLTAKSRVNRIHAVRASRSSTKLAVHSASCMTLDKRSTVPWLVKQYDHEAHHAHVLDICADVYGGTDYLPRMMEHYSKEEHVLALVAEHPEHSTIGGIVCCDQRGSVIFLFGLRVSKNIRKQGLAKFLLAAIVAESRSAFPGTKAMMTVTIPQNPAAICLFSKLLSQQPTHTAESWPSWDVLARFEKSLGWPEKQAGLQDSVLNAVEGAMDMMRSDEAAVAQLGAWRPTSLYEELHQAVSSIKQASGVEPTVLDFWLPAMYEVIPLDSPTMAVALAEGQVWLLKDTPEQNGVCDPATTSSHAGASQLDAVSTSTDQHCSPRYLGALFAYRSRESRRQVVGLLAAHPSVIHSGLLLAATRLLASSPHFMTFIERAPGCGMPDVYKLNQPQNWIAFGKRCKEHAAMSGLWGSRQLSGNFGGQQSPPEPV